MCVYVYVCVCVCVLQWDVDHQVTVPLATMSVVFNFIFVLEVGLCMDVGLKEVGL